MNEVKEMVEELRNKKSRDNRDLLDRSADMIEKLAKELCEKSSCHHKCHDTTDCVVEEEAKELFKQALVEGLNRHFDRKIEEAKKIEQIEEMAQFMVVISYLECGKKSCEECKWLGRGNDKADCTDYLIAEHLYNAGYRKQSAGEWLQSDIPQEKYVCSVCGGACWYYDYQGEVAKSRYCPNCGSKMKGGE